MEQDRTKEQICARNYYTYKNFDRDFLTMPGTRKLDHLTQNDYAMPLKQPGVPSHEKRKMENSVMKSTKEFQESAFIQNRWDEEKKAKYINSINLKSQLSRLYRSVDIRMKAMDQDLDDKRDKLRSILLSEEKALTREYIEKAQNRAAEIFEQKKNYVNEILIAQEKEKMEKAAAKAEEVARLSSMELRTQKSEILRMEAAAVQKQQICEKLLKEQRTAEEEKFWIDVWKKIDDEKKRIEEEDERVRQQKIIENQHILKLQIKGKELQKEECERLRKQEAEFIERLSDRIKEENELERNSKLEEMRELKKTMDAQLEEYRQMKEKKKQEELEYDRLLAEVLFKLAKEEDTIIHDSKAQQRIEAELFQHYLKELREAKIKEEEQTEVLRQQEVAKKYEVVKNNIKIAKTARAQLNREVMETRAQQIIEKQRSVEREKEAEKDYEAWVQYMLEKNLEFDERKRNASSRQDLREEQALIDQQKYELIQAERRKKEDEELQDKLKESQETSDTVAVTLKPYFGHVHPFSKVLWENKK